MSILGDKKLKMETNLQKTEINASINLPNLSKEAEGFLCRIAAPALIAGSEFLTTKFRAATFNTICELSNKYAEQLAVDIKPTPPKFLLPFIEKASLEDDVDLQKEWAKLLVIAGIEYNPLHLQYSEILSQIGGKEARLLKEIYKRQNLLLGASTLAVKYNNEINSFRFNHFIKKNLIGESLYSPEDYYEDVDITFDFPYCETFEMDEYKIFNKSIISLQKMGIIEIYEFKEPLGFAKLGLLLTTYGYDFVKALEDIESNKPKI